MGLVVDIEPLGDVASQVAAALNTFRSAEELADEHLVGALRMALEADPDPDEESDLVATLFDDPRLLGSPDRAADVARLTALLPDWRLAQVQTAIAAYISDHSSVLSSALSDLGETAAVRLIRSDEIWEAVTNFVTSHDPDSVRPFLTDLMERGLEGLSELELAFQIQGRLLHLRDPTAYEVAASAAVRVLGARRAPDQVQRRALEGLTQAPPAHWELWSTFLNERDGNG
jgi:hypothetical protein